MIAQAGATCCLMHNKHNTQYDNLLLECLESLRRSAEKAVAAGVPREKILYWTQVLALAKPVNKIYI